MQSQLLDVKNFNSTHFNVTALHLNRYIFYTYSNVCYVKKYIQLEQRWSCTTCFSR